MQALFLNFTINFIYYVSTHYFAHDVCKWYYTCTLTHDNGFCPSITRLKPGLNRFAGKTGFAQAKVQPCPVYTIYCSHKN